MLKKILILLALLTILPVEANAACSGTIPSCDAAVAFKSSDLFEGRPSGSTVDKKFSGTQIQAGITPVTNFVCDGTNQTTAINTLLSTSGSYIFGPAGATCKFDGVNETSVNLTLDSAQGVTLEPYTASNITGALITLTTSILSVKNLTIEGLHYAEQGIELIGGQMQSPSTNLTVKNIGWTATNDTQGVIGLLLDDVASSYVLGNLTFSGFSEQYSGTCNAATFAGAMRGVEVLNTAVPSYVEIGTINWSGGAVSGDNGVQIDIMHAGVGTQGGVVHNMNVAYNGNIRRIMKVQSGHWVLENFEAYKGSDFKAANVAGSDGTGSGTCGSTSTQVGCYTLNAFDYAGGGTNATFDIKSGYGDLSGFVVGATSSGSGGVITVGPNVTLKGATQNMVRNSTVCNGSQSAGEIGFFSTSNDTGSGMNGTTMVNFGRACVLDGSQSYVRNVTFKDPVVEACEVGFATVKDSVDFSRNTVITSTPQYLSASTGMVRVQNVTNLKAYNNNMISSGNLYFASNFIDVTNSGATGAAMGNLAAAGAISATAGSSAVTVSMNNAFIAAADIPNPLTFPGAFSPKVITPAISTATFNINAALGNKFVIGLVHASCPCTIANPTNPVAGEKILFEILQSATGSDTIGTWDTAFNFGAQATPTLTTTASKYDLVGFQYNGTSSKWEYLGSELGF